MEESGNIKFPWENIHFPSELVTHALWLVVAFIKAITYVNSLDVNKMTRKDCSRIIKLDTSL